MLLFLQYIFQDHRRNATHLSLRAIHLTQWQHVFWQSPVSLTRSFNQQERKMQLHENPIAELILPSPLIADKTGEFTGAA